MVLKGDDARVAQRKLEIETAEQEVTEIFGTFYSPRFTLESYTGVVPDAKGDITDTTDTNDEYNDLGPFLRVDLKVIQPLYSFGKYASAKQAGASNLVMRRAMLQDEENDITLETAKTFLGVVAGRDGLEVGKELQERYRSLLTELEKRVGTADSEFDDSDLLEARSLQYEIDKQVAGVASDTAQAELYLKGLLNLERDAAIAVHKVEEPVFADNGQLVAQLQKHFREQSHRLKGVDAGMDALRQKAELERKKQYPDLFLALGAGYGTAPGRDKQDNAFVKDDYNYERLGGMLGLKWEMNYHVDSAKREKASIEYRQLAEKRRLLLQVTDGNIEKLCGEAARQQQLWHAADDSYKAARNWLRLEKENLDIGAGDMRGLIRAHQRYFQLKGEVISTRHRYLVTLAELANAAGSTNLLLNWLENGKVEVY